MKKNQAHPSNLMALNEAKTRQDKQKNEKMNAEYQAKMQEMLGGTYFKSEFAVPEFFSLLKKALLFNSISRLKCSAATYENFIFNNRDFLMSEMYLAIECLSVATPIEMEQSLEENFQMLRDVIEPMKKAWAFVYDETSEKLKKQISDKYSVDIVAVPSLGSVGLS